jgi:ribosomal protein S18 acetylase RimI-like enzyme
LAFRRPDGKWFVQAPDEAADGDAYASVDEHDVERWLRAGFTVCRRENDYVLPTTTVGDVAPPPGIELVGADRVPEDALRLLDDELRQDVPGTDGWQWDAGDFREETYASSAYDPAVYIVACDGERYVGIVRVWMRSEGPRLGFVGVSRSHRRRGIASALLSRAFRELVARGVLEVTTSIDEANVASRGLLEGLGARATGSSLELVRPA